MNSIGGYFGLELNHRDEYHQDCLSLNTGRNALEYILTAKKYEKIYIPYYTCDVILEPIKKLNIAFEFYSIDLNFEVQFEFKSIKVREVLLYTNYFGLKDSYIKKLKSECGNLIIDNAQSFFSKPLVGLDTFYSPRKFFGLPDGAYLYTDKLLETTPGIDISYHRFEHLLKRLDESAEMGYPDFKKNDAGLCNQPILKMSNLTKNLLQNIDYKAISKKRVDNYNYLSSALLKINKIKIELNNKMVPMVYPFYSNNSNLKALLLQNKIYTANYWPNVLEWVAKDSIENDYTRNIVHLPIDQRITKTDLNKIIKIITHEYQR
jgi:hypothetical protein